MVNLSRREKMKSIIGLFGIVMALCFSGCIVERPERERPAVIVAPPPPPPVVVAPPPGAVVEVPYDDPHRGWYIEGYFGPNRVWIAPFWTFDINVVHRYFDHYRGRHRGQFEEHFKRHPEKFEDRGREREEHHEH